MSFADTVVLAVCVPLLVITVAIVVGVCRTRWKKRAARTTGWRRGSCQRNGKSASTRKYGATYYVHPATNARRAGSTPAARRRRQPSSQTALPVPDVSSVGCSRAQRCGPGAARLVGGGRGRTAIFAALDSARLCRPEKRGGG